MISPPAVDPERSDGVPAERRDPVRTCVGCRRRDEVTGLLRVVVRGSTVVPDPRRRLPGRGAHVHPDPECLALAQRRRAFPRALRVPGPLDTTAVEQHVQRGTSSGGSADSAGPVDTR